MIKQYRELKAMEKESKGLPNNGRYTDLSDEDLLKLYLKEKKEFYKDIVFILWFISPLVYSFLPLQENKAITYLVPIPFWMLSIYILEKLLEEK